MAVITISREYGSRGEEIGQKVAETLGYSYFDKELLADVARAANLSEEEVSQYDEKDEHGLRAFLKRMFIPDMARSLEVTHYWPAEFPMDPLFYSYEANRVDRKATVRDADDIVTFFREVIENLSERGNVVIVGRGGQKILAARPRTFHFRFVGQLKDRIKQVVAQENLTEEDALKKIEKIDKQREHHFKHYFDGKWADPTLYHLIVNTSLVNGPLAVDTIVEIARKT